MSDKPNTTVGRESDKFMLRFPDGMRDRIAELAQQNGRSMNAEIVARLEQSFAGGGDQSALVAAIARLNLELAKTEIDLSVSRRDTGHLADLLQRVANALLEVADESDVPTRAFAQGSIKIADLHIGNLDEYDAEIPGKVERVLKAGDELKLAIAPLREPSTAPEPAEPSKRATRTSGRKAAQASSDEAEAPKPPTARR